MTGNDHNIALLSFFITYILFKVPSNLVSCVSSRATEKEMDSPLHTDTASVDHQRVRPSMYLSTIMGLWGIATVGQGFVKNLKGLIACRILVGLFEAGLFPGCLYLISS